jgi:hypothetical protein
MDEFLNLNSCPFNRLRLFRVPAHGREKETVQKHVRYFKKSLTSILWESVCCLHLAKIPAGFDLGPVGEGRKAQNCVHLVLRGKGQS